MKRIIGLFFYLGSFLPLTGCFNEVAFTPKADFTIQFVDDSQAAPARLRIENTSTNSDFYKWTFEGTTITSFDDRTPPELLFLKEGRYKVTLEVSNIDNLIDRKEIIIEIGNALVPKFSVSFDINNSPPATALFTNESVGATRFEWSFQGATPATSTERNPKIVFDKEGKFNVSLKAFNGQKFVQFDSTIVIGSELKPDFTSTNLDFNFHQEAPLLLRVVNTSKGAQTHTWLVDDPAAKITSVTDSITTILLPEPKSYQITIRASNGKKTEDKTVGIVVNKSTNLLHLKDVKLGVPQASTSPSFFVTRRKLGIQESELDTLSFSRELDIVFFSQDESFNYSRFISPDRTSSVLLPAVPNAQRTSFINVIETCATCTKVTESQFQDIQKADDFKKFVFPFSDGVIEGFSKQITPRFVPFRTANGRTGIVKIKSFVNEGANHYILADIKVARKP
ncbi:MAG: PKD domain-containing protein [Spirosomataceae bacterium]